MLLKAKTIFLLSDGDSKRTVYPGETANADERTALELISLGAAMEIPHPDTTSARLAPANVVTSESPVKSENAQNGSENAEDGVTHETLEAMSFTQLKEMAKSMGIEAGKIKSKSDMIEAIMQEGESILTEDDELPDLSPQDVVDE